MGSRKGLEIPRPLEAAQSPRLRAHPWMRTRGESCAVRTNPLPAGLSGQTLGAWIPRASIASM